MSNILDHVPQTPLLDGLDDWPRSATRKEWFRITSQLVASTIVDMDLDDAAEADMIEAFRGAGLLHKFRPK